MISGGVQSDCGGGNSDSLGAVSRKSRKLNRSEKGSLRTPYDGSSWIQSNTDGVYSDGYLGLVNGTSSFRMGSEEKRKCLVSAHNRPSRENTNGGFGPTD